MSCGNPTITVHEGKLRIDGITRYVDNQTFEFDNTYNEDETTNDMYCNSILPEMDFIFNGGTLTIFAYGQTGSGKTYTINELQTFLCKDLFRASDLHNEDTGRNIGFSVSYFEIYGGKVFDLLNKRKKLKIMESGKNKIEIPGLREIMVKNKEELTDVIDFGRSERGTESTGNNLTSSRSHAIVKINLHDADKPINKNGGSLLIVDLAGSERAQDSQNNQQERQIEAAQINKSLLALKEGIRAMQSTKSNQHIPFRTSKLTMILKDSFISLKSEVRVHMIAGVSPGHGHVDHSLNTLRYAEKLKMNNINARTNLTECQTLTKENSTLSLNNVKVSMV